MDALVKFVEPEKVSRFYFFCILFFLFFFLAKLVFWKYLSFHVICACFQDAIRGVSSYLILQFDIYMFYSHCSINQLSVSIFNISFTHLYGYFDNNYYYQAIICYAYKC